MAVTIDSTVRIRLHQESLLGMWKTFRKMDEIRDGTGIPDLDRELTATWGGFDRDKPFSKPFDGGPVPPDIQERYDAFDLSASPIATAVKVVHVAEEKVSSWGLDVNKKIRAMPGFADTVQAGLSDKDLARAIWARWQQLTGPNKLQRIHAEWTGVSTDGNAISSWGKATVAKLRAIQGFSSCPASRLSDKELAVKVWEVWQTMTGPNRVGRIAVQFMAEGR
jgi:hypothetical protein